MMEPRGGHNYAPCNVTSSSCSPGCGPPIGQFIADCRPDETACYTNRRSDRHELTSVVRPLERANVSAKSSDDFARLQDFHAKRVVFGNDSISTWHACSVITTANVVLS